MLFRLRDKLILLLVVANAALALFMYLGSSMSFDRQFHDYLARQEDARLDSLVHALGEGYEQRGNWNWITGNRATWFALIRQHLLPESRGSSARPPEPRSDMYIAQPPADEEHPTTNRSVRSDQGRPPSDRSSSAGGRPPPPNRSSGRDQPQPGADRAFGDDERSRRPERSTDIAGRPPGPVDALTLSPFILLLDEDREVIEGPPHAIEGLELKPIKVNDKLVGYLGFKRRPELAQAVDVVFADAQRQAFVELAFAMLLMSVVLAVGIASYLARPIKQLRRSTTALIEGRYETRTAVHGNDELAELGSHFNQLAKTLEANRDARRQWIADIAHELRTPLSVLKAEVEALQDGIRQPSLDRLASLAQEIDRLSQLVEDLHTLSVADLGALSYRKSGLDLGDLVSTVLDSHRPSLVEAGIETVLVVQGSNVLSGDSARLAQLVTNLAQNTRRYTDAPGQLYVRVHSQGGRVILDWKDSKPGVADHELALLTNRMFRVESSRNRELGGAGLGLAIARAIVDAHDGTMEARHSDLGGVWWRISFPRGVGAEPRLRATSPVTEVK